jgi:hypothetical protein
VSDNHIEDMLGDDCFGLLWELGSQGWSLQGANGAKHWAPRR